MASVLLNSAETNPEFKASQHNPWLPTISCMPQPLAELEAAQTRNPRKDTISLFPDLGLAMLRTEQAAAGRIWLLLRYLDQQGQGWVSVEEARAALSRKESPLRIVGWRQLRNLLHQGEGVFWQRDKTRIWLRSLPNVAVALDVARLSGCSIALPVQTLLNGIGDVRAHFYASFHSGRKQAATATQRQPIARETLAAISGVGRSSQLNYEQRTQTAVHTNIAIGERVSANNQQARAWQQGNALFILEDKQGKQGAKGTRYLAWQLPNSYVGPHNQNAKGQRRRINRKLADLLNTRATGNSKPQIEQRYFATGAAAVMGGFGRNNNSLGYWQQSAQQVWLSLS